MSNSTLYVRHLPAELKVEDCEDLLKHFGASAVRYMGDRGRMKHSAFATFESAEAAASALRRLHQLELLGTRLVVEFSTGNLSDLHPSALGDVPCKPAENSDVPLSVSYI